MFKYTVLFFDRLMRRYTPDPYVLALLITFIIFFLALCFTPATPKELVEYWGDHFWFLMSFTLQMSMALVGGYVVALSPPLKSFLNKMSKRIQTQGQAIVLATLVSALASYLNWGLGLVVGGLVCREIMIHKPEINFRLLVASAYSGFLVWHGGLSGSIPLIIATPDNFSYQWIGKIIPVTQTLFSSFNLVAVLGLVVLLLCVNYMMGRYNDQTQTVCPRVSQPEMPEKEPINPAEKLEYTPFIPWAAGILALSYLYVKVDTGKLVFDINIVNFIFIFLALIFYARIKLFLNAINEAVSKIGPLLIQYPLYAGIMGIITHSKFVEILSQWFVEVSTPKTFPLLTFLSAGLINLFIPSGGGQWIVQGPVVIQAAQNLKVDMALASMAVAWGDSWTNLLQPFWALPLVAIAGLTLRDIMGYCVFLLFITGIFLSLVFYIAA